MAFKKWTEAQEPGRTKKKKLTLIYHSLIKRKEQLQGWKNIWRNNDWKFSKLVKDINPIQQLKTQKEIHPRQTTLILLKARRKIIKVSEIQGNKNSKDKAFHQETKKPEGSGIVFSNY